MQITYTPRQEGDPYKTKIKGIIFEANKAVEVKDREILEGEIGKGRNPWFKVEGVDQVDPQGGWDRRKKPKTAEDYRRYATQWLNDEAPDPTVNDPDIAAKQCAARIRARWKDEEDLRNLCGVGMDDKELLAKLFDPKLAKFDPEAAQNPAS